MHSSLTNSLVSSVQDVTLVDCWGLTEVFQLPCEFDVSIDVDRIVLFLLS